MTRFGLQWERRFNPVVCVLHLAIKVTYWGLVYTVPLWGTHNLKGDIFLHISFVAFQFRERSSCVALWAEGKPEPARGVVCSPDLLISIVCTHSHSHFLEGIPESSQLWSTSTSLLSTESQASGLLWTGVCECWEGFSRMPLGFLCCKRISSSLSCWRTELRR